MTVTTTQVFPAMARLYDLLSAETTFPPHDSGDTPLVVFGGLVNEASRELIVILGAPPDTPEIDFADLGVVGHDEVFVIRIAVATMVPGQFGTDVMARLGELTATIETALRDQTTGRPVGINISAILWHRIGRIMPSLSLGPEGVEGQCLIDIVFRSRI